MFVILGVRYTESLLYANSRCITENLRSNIISQQVQYVVNPKIKEKKNKIKSEKHAKYRETLEAVQSEMNDDQKRLNDIFGVSISPNKTIIPLIERKFNSLFNHGSLKANEANFRKLD